MDNYNGLSLFQDVRNKELRAYNQATVIINLSLEDKNFKNYMEAIPKEDYTELFKMLSNIKANTHDNVKKDIIARHNL